jgi:hypothetical protein
MSTNRKAYEYDPPGPGRIPSPFKKRRTLERKKKGWARLRESVPPADKDYWVCGTVCRGRWGRAIKGRRRIHHTCYQHWTPPLNHSEWGQEKVVIKHWRRA